jgi:hypothetical protein
MATVQDYVSGNVCQQLEKAFAIFDAAGSSSLEGSEIGGILLANVCKLAPQRLTMQEAIKMIENSRQCAVGARVCRSVHKETPLTESVFLDELAEGMVDVGKARRATQAEAVKNMHNYRKYPIIVSKVSGKYAEICPTWPKRCLYWTMEKHHLKCIQG